MTAPKDITTLGGEFLVYTAEDGRTRVDVRFSGQTAWLSLGQMAELFQRDKSVISRHVKNAFDEGELSAEATVAKSATVQSEGKRQITREVDYYNLDVIISVGYRVKSLRGSQFRIWATQRLREYIIKGFALDDEASQLFFKTVQNKMHWAAHGHTAAEVIATPADAGKTNMGLTSFAGGIPRKADALVAKNYLEYDWFAEQRAASPSDVETHFDEAVRNLKKLENKKLENKDPTNRTKKS